MAASCSLRGVGAEASRLTTSCFTRFSPLKPTFLKSVTSAKCSISTDIQVSLCEWGGHLFWKQAKFDLCIPPDVLPSGCDAAVGKSIQRGWQNAPLDCSQRGVKPRGGWSNTAPQPDATRPRSVESMEKKCAEQ